MSVLLLGPLSGGLSAQSTPGEVDNTDWLEGAVTASVVFDQCVTELPIDVRASELDCRVVSIKELGLDSGSSAWILTYRRSVVQAHDEFVDTLDIDELVLVQRPESAEHYELKWRAWRDRTYEFLLDTDVAPQQGGALLSYDICLNGTGGCDERFLFGSEGRWQSISESYREGLAAAVPDGWSLHKGRRLNVSTLRGVQPIALPTDANCCPSGHLDFEVELRGGDLSLVHARRGSDT
jgi:hypothetical protein